MLSYKLWDTVNVNVMLIFTDIGIILLLVGGGSGSVHVYISILCVVMFISVIMDKKLCYSMFQSYYIVFIRSYS